MWSKIGYHAFSFEPRYKIIPYEIQGSPWEVIDTDLLSIDKSIIYCIVENHSKLPIVKHMEKLSVERSI